MGSPFSTLRNSALALTTVFSLSSAALWYNQNKLIYFGHMPPGSRSEVPVPQQFGIQNSKSVKFPTPDGETLHAYLLLPPAYLKKNVTLLTFHGNAGNIGHRLPIGQVLSESLGCHVLMVEYRGYGLSTGTADENGLTIDAQAALDYVRNHSELRKTNIVLYGQSLGGAVAIKLLKRNESVGDIAGVILENTFLSIRKMIPVTMPPVKYLAPLCHQRWDSETAMGQLKVNTPILFLSGSKDELVPPSMMEALFNLCPTKKVLKHFPEGDHNATCGERGYFDAILDFLVDYVVDSSAKNEGRTTIDPKGPLWT